MSVYCLPFHQLLFDKSDPLASAKDDAFGVLLQPSNPIISQQRPV
jgi:hypothetical protein